MRKYGAHSIKNKDTIHFLVSKEDENYKNKWYYACMQACSTTDSKSTRNFLKVTCQNCIAKIKKIIRIEDYKCPICHRIYKSMGDAMDCFEIGIDHPIVEVGDIVFLRSGFGWFDGDKRWVSNPKVLEKHKGVPYEKRHKDRRTNCFDSCCTFQFYHVVTAIDYDPRDSHRTRYHIATKAMKKGNAYRYGFTFNQGHIRPSKVRNPPKFVVKDSKDMIGHKAEWLVH
jgi:hypothetical protein